MHIISFYVLDSHCKCNQFDKPKGFDQFVFSLIDAQEGEVHFIMSDQTHMSCVIPMRTEKESLYDYYRRLSCHDDVCRLWNSVCHLL